MKFRMGFNPKDNIDLAKPHLISVINTGRNFDIHPLSFDLSISFLTLYLDLFGNPFDRFIEGEAHLIGRTATKHIPQATAKDLIEERKRILHIAEIKLDIRI